MSLRLYTDVSLIPDGVEYKHNSNTFFITRNKLLPDTDEVRRLMREIDKAEYQTDKTFIGRFIPNAGILNRYLSTGCKTALNILLFPDICFDAISAGDNAKEAIVRIKDGIVVMEDTFMSSGRNCDIDVIMNDKYKVTKLFSCEPCIKSLFENDDRDLLKYEGVSLL